jgi:hypothetical protein
MINDHRWGEIMKPTKYLTVEHPSGYETVRCEHGSLKVSCPVCHVTIRFGEKPFKGDLLLCWNCDELTEILSEAPLTLIRVFDDPIKETSLVLQGNSSSKFSLN